MEFHHQMYQKWLKTSGNPCGGKKKITTAGYHWMHQAEIIETCFSLLITHSAADDKDRNAHTKGRAATASLYWRAAPSIEAWNYLVIQSWLDKGFTSTQLPGQWCGCILGSKELVGVHLLSLNSGNHFHTWGLVCVNERTGWASVCQGPIVCAAVDPIAVMA